MPQLETAAAAFGIDVIGNRGAAGLDGFEQNLADRAMQAGRPLPVEPRAQRARMNAGAVERLIGVDVPHAAGRREWSCRRSAEARRAPRARSGTRPPGCGCPRGGARGRARWFRLQEARAY